MSRLRPNRTDGRTASAPPEVLAWGVAVGLASAALPAVLSWLPALTVHAVSVCVIAAVYVGFAVGDGRPHVVAVETVVATCFVLLAAVALDVTGSVWLVVAALVLHGVKDLWQHRTQFVRRTRWWPRFCVAVDWTAASAVAVVALT